MNYNYKVTQDAFSAITQLAQLCATPGITEETKELANLQIRNLLELLKPEFSKLSLASNNILSI